MTDPVAIALISGLCVAVPAVVGNFLTSRGTGKKIDENAKVAIVATQAAANSATKAAVVTETIHGLVNSQLAVVTSERDEARLENSQLKAMNAQLLALLVKAGIKINGGQNPNPLGKGPGSGGGST